MFCLLHLFEIFWTVASVNCCEGGQCQIIHNGNKQVLLSLSLFFSSPFPVLVFFIFISFSLFLTIFSSYSNFSKYLLSILVSLMFFCCCSLKKSHFIQTQKRKFSSSFFLSFPFFPFFLFFILFSIFVWEFSLGVCCC